MERFPKDILVKLSLELGIADILTLCQTNKNIRHKLCNNIHMWNYKLDLGKEEKEEGKEEGKQQLTAKEIYEIFLKIEKEIGKVDDETFKEYFYGYKLQKMYPKLSKSTKDKYMSYKDFYNKVLDTIQYMKNKYGYTFTEGNPFTQKLLLDFFLHDKGDYLFMESMLNKDNYPLIYFSIDKVKKPLPALTLLEYLYYPIMNGDINLIKFLYEKGFVDREQIQMILYNYHNNIKSPEMIKYLSSL